MNEPNNPNIPKIPNLRRFTMTAAKGTASFPMTKGSFQYRDRVRSRTVLTASEGKLKDASGKVLGTVDAQEGSLLSVRITGKVKLDTETVIELP